MTHPSALYKHAGRIGACIHNDTGIIETAWRHGKSESTPSLTNVFRRRTNRLNFFARITSARMSFRFCANGVAVLGTVWIPAAQSKRRSSAGACVDGNWRQLEKFRAKIARALPSKTTREIKRAEKNDVSPQA